jgi:hypothetical protein
MLMDIFLKVITSASATMPTAWIMEWSQIPGIAARALNEKVTNGQIR